MCIVINLFISDLRQWNTYLEVSHDFYFCIFYIPPFCHGTHFLKYGICFFLVFWLLKSSCSRTRLILDLLWLKTDLNWNYCDGKFRHQRFWWFNVYQMSSVSRLISTGVLLTCKIPRPLLHFWDSFLIEKLLETNSLENSKGSQVQHQLKAQLLSNKKKSSSFFVSLRQKKPRVEVGHDVC